MEKLNNELLLNYVGGSKLNTIINTIVHTLRKLANTVLIVKGSAC